MVNVLTLGGLRILKVLELSIVRGPYSVAQTLYEDHTPPPDPKEIAPPRMSHGKGRPTKRPPAFGSIQVDKQEDKCAYCR